MPMFASVDAMAQAVALGPAGDPSAAADFAEARNSMLSFSLGPALAHTGALFLAPVAHRDGWGDPIGWLRAAEAFFAGLGHDRPARRCRVLLGEFGAPMPRRGRGDSEVPSGLRALGITSREVDVLKLVAAGCTNRVIAEELTLSQKTVERHMSSLFTRAGVANRRDLAALAAQHLDRGE
jgi:DNA-binding CsgD family transcriptional regulator